MIRLNKFGFYVVFNLLTLHYALAIMCYICGQTNLPPPGECTTQFQYDCNIVDPNQQQQGGRTDRSKMICRTTRSKVSPNSYSVSKECVSEDEHLIRYPDGKAFGCENVFPNTINEVSYCVCDHDFCNGRSFNEQQVVQQQQLAGSAVQQGGGSSVFSDGTIANFPVGAPVGSGGIQFQPELPSALPLPQQSPPLAQDQGLLLPAPPPLTPQLPANINEFGRTPPGGSISPSSPSASENGPAILVPPLILPNNSLLLPPYPTSSAQPFSSRISNPAINAAPQQLQPVPNAAQPVGRNPAIPQPPLLEERGLAVEQQNVPVAVNAGFAVHVQGEPPNQVQGVRTGAATVQSASSQHQLKPSLNWTTLEDHVVQQQPGESFVEQNQPPESPSHWPIQTVQSHLVAQTANGTRNPLNARQQQQSGDDIPSSLTCVTCAETNLTSGSDCRKQVPIDCLRQFSSESRIFCFTKDTLLPTGQHTVEKRCASEEVLSRELGLQLARESCGQTRPQSPIEFQYCICSTESCNQISLQQQLVLYANSLQSQPAPVQQPQQNQWAQHLQQQLAGRQPSKPATTESQATTPIAEGKKCYVCGESDLHNAADCSQQYEYNCNQQYQSTGGANVKILCLTRQTKLSNGLFSIEKRCIAESEHKQQYPGAQVVSNGCGEAWNGYVQYCVCADSELCNGPNITVQQYQREYTPTDVHQQIDPFSTLSKSTPSTSKRPTNLNSTFDPSSSSVTKNLLNTTSSWPETKPTTTFNPRVAKKPADIQTAVDDPEHQQRKATNSSKTGTSERQAGGTSDGSTNGVQMLTVMLLAFLALHFNCQS